MKAKQFILPIVIFIFGVIFNILGALFKIQHWPFAPELLTLGVLIEVVSLVVLMVILIKYFFKK